MELSAHLRSILGINLYLDKILFVIVLFYMYLCAFFGIVKFGIHGYCGINFEGRGLSYLFRVKRRSSYPQALTLAATFITLMLLAVHMQLSHYLPQYMLFSHQVYKEGSPMEGKICKFHHDFTSSSYLKEAIQRLKTNGCHLSIISFNHIYIQLEFPIINLFNFSATILLITSFVLFMVYHAFFKENDSADLGGQLQGQYNTLDMSHDDNEE